MRWLKALLDIFLPRTCVVCGRKLLLREEHLCLYCQMDIPQTYFWSLDHNPMADRFNAQIQEHGPLTGERYAYACALFFYRDTSPYKNILYDLKYRGNISVGRYFGRVLGRKLSSSRMFHDVDCIVPVPLHWRRRWKRGYNQAEVIASAISSETGVPMHADLLRRNRHTVTQTRLAPEDKKANVEGVFEATDRALTLRSGNPMHILIVDDVFTTGSTLYACFTALRTVFPPSVRISVATLAFVGDS